MAATRYLEILAVSDPFPYGVDGNNRILFSCNFSAVAATPVVKFEEEIGRLIFDAGLGAFNSSMFLGPNAKLPDEPVGPYVTIINTGGTSPIETHDSSKYKRLSFQIIVRSNNYFTARARALAIWDALDGRRNISVEAA